MRCSIFIFLLIISNSLQSQGVEKIISALKSAEVFKNCLQFRNDMATKMTDVKSKPSLDPEALNNFKSSYNDVYEKYDAFLKTVKADLSNIENLKNLIKNPDQAAAAYASSYQAVKDAYESSFLIQYAQLTSGGTKAIPLTVLLKFGFDAFKLIVNSIKTHKINKEESINLLLPLINEQLFNKLKLPTWSQLNMPQANAISSANATVTATPETVVIPAKTLNSLSGYIKILSKAPGQTAEQPIAFSYKEGQKDLVVASENNTTATDEYFTTTEKFPVGSMFRAEINNSAFTYVLALNSNGIALLHPQLQDPTQFAANKDLVVKDETPQTGLVNVPSLSSSNSYRYFSIVKNVNNSESAAEELAILLSKSELVVAEILQKLNSVTGNLSERITKVFAEQKIATAGANLSFEENTIKFNADNSPQSVLPLVIKILKQ